MVKSTAIQEEAEVVDLQDIQTIILALMNSRGSKGANEDEIDLVVSWAHQAKINATLLELVLKQIIAIDLIGGEISFKVKDEFLPGRRNTP